MAKAKQSELPVESNTVTFTDSNLSVSFYGPAEYVLSGSYVIPAANHYSKQGIGSYEESDKGISIKVHLSSDVVEETKDYDDVPELPLED